MNYMIAEYLTKALKKAHFEIIEDEDPYYGEISELEGVWAVGKSLEECRENLINTIEGWILLRVKKGLAIPPLDDITISIPQELEVSD